MLIDSDSVLAVLQSARKRALKVAQSENMNSFSAGRLQGIEESLCLVESLAASLEHGDESCLDLEIVE